MKSLLLTLVIGLLVVQSQAQSVPFAPNQYNKFQQEEGKWIYLFRENGTITENLTEAVYYRLLTFKEGLAQDTVRDFLLDHTPLFIVVDLSRDLSWERLQLSRFNKHGVLMDKISLLRRNNEEQLHNQNNWYRTGYSVKTKSRTDTYWWMRYIADGMLEEYNQEGQLLTRIQLEKGLKIPDSGTYYNEEGREISEVEFYMEFLNESEVQALLHRLDGHMNYAMGKADTMLIVSVLKEKLILLDEKVGITDIEYIETLELLGMLYGEWGGLYSLGGGIDINKIDTAISYLIIATDLRKKTNQEDYKILDVLKKLESERERILSRPITLHLDSIFSEITRYYFAGDRKSSYQKTLTLKGKVANLLGKDNFYYAISLILEGQALSSSSNIDSALILIQQGLALLEQMDTNLDETLHVDPTKRFFYSMGMMGVAIVYQDKADFQQAREIFRHLIDINKQSYYPLDEIRIMANLGLANLYSTQGKTDVTLDILLWLLQGFLNERFSLTNPEFGNYILPIIYSNVAAAYQKIGEPEKAETFMQVLLRVTPETHPARSATLITLARWHHDAGQYEIADSLTHEAMTLFKQSVGETHYDYLMAINQLAFIAERNDKFALADSLFRVSEEGLRNLGYQDASYFAAKGNRLGILSSIYQKLAYQHSSADTLLYYKRKGERLYPELVKEIVQTMGKENETYIITLANYALFSSSTGNYSRADSLYKEIIDLTKAIYGDSNHKLSTFYHNWTISQWRQGHVKQAYELLFTTNDLFDLQLSKYLPFLSEREKLLFIQREYRQFQQEMFSFAYQHRKKIPSIGGLLLNNSLKTRGIGLRLLKNINAEVRKLDNPKAQRLYKEWEEIRLSINYAHGFSKQERERRSIHLDQLEFRADSMERALSKFVPDEQHKTPDWTELKKELQLGEVLISFQDFRYTNV